MKTIWKYYGIDTKGNEIRKDFEDGADCARFARQMFNQGVIGSYAPWTVKA